MRVIYPFAVVTGSTISLSASSGNFTAIKGIYLMRDVGSFFKPAMTMNGYDQIWDIDLKTFVKFRQNSNI